MNKQYLSITLAAFAAAAALSSCSTSRVADVNALAGEWNVLKIDGKQVNATAADDDPAPYLAFDIKNSRIFGNAGCNNLNGSLFIGENADLQFKDVATTRRICPDMATEDAMVNALNQVASFDITKNGELQLRAADGKNLIDLVKRPDAISPGILEGQWQILYIGETDLSADTLGQYNAEFIPADSTVVFSTGCNDISGRYSAKYIDLQFDNLRSTRMSCPDMSVEIALNNILPQITSFATLAQEGWIGLYDRNGELQIVLARPAETSVEIIENN